MALFKDSYHIYKIVGLFALLSYMYQIYSLIIYQNIIIDSRIVALDLCASLAHMSSAIFTTNHTMFYELRIHNSLLVVRSILCLLCFHYALHIASNMILCFMNMIAFDVVKKSNITSLAQVPSILMENLEDCEKQKLTNMFQFMQIVATYYMLENSITAYLPLLPIQIVYLLVQMFDYKIINKHQLHYFHTLSVWLNIFAIINAKVSFILMMPVFCNFMYFWNIANNMNKYAGWLIAFSSYYIFRESTAAFIDEYIANAGLFYIYMVKYSIIWYILNYYHLKFHYELVYNQPEL